MMILFTVRAMTTICGAPKHARVITRVPVVGIVS